MDGPDELEKFVRKFRSLWQSGCNAKLSVESEAGHAFVNLRVGLGPAPPGPHHHVVRGRGGGPSRQRRRERRAVERQATTAAEEAVVDAKDRQVEDVAEEATNEAKNVSVEDIARQRREVTTSPIPQIDGTTDEVAHYVLKVEANEKCSNDHVIEAIEENFFGTLDDQKVEKTDPVRHLVIQEKHRKLIEVQTSYRIAVMENEVATKVIEGWSEPYEFDDLALKNAVHGEIKINIKDVQKVR